MAGLGEDINVKEVSDEYKQGRTVRFAEGGGGLDWTFLTLIIYVLICNMPILDDKMI